MTPDQSTTPPSGDMVLTARGWLPRADVFTGVRVVETAGEVARHTDRYDRLTGEYLGGECHVQVKSVTLHVKATFDGAPWIDAPITLASLTDDDERAVMDALSDAVRPFRDAAAKTKD